MENSTKAEPARDQNLVTSDKLQTQPSDAVKPEIGAVMKRGAPPAEPTRKRKGGDEVLVRITKKGHGQVHDGDGGTYVWNDEVVLPRAVAEGQEANGFAEIQE